MNRDHNLLPFPRREESVDPMMRWLEKSRAAARREERMKRKASELNRASRTYGLMVAGFLILYFIFQLGRGVYG